MREPNQIDKQIGLLVKARRMMIGMSQEKLGDALGLTFQQIQKYEKGVNRISASRLHHIAQVLQTSVAYFSQGIEDKNNASSGFAESPKEENFSSYISTSDGLRLNKAFLKISDPKIRRKLVELVETLSGGDVEEKLKV